MEKSVKKDGAGSVVWRALDLRQSLSVIDALVAFIVNGIVFTFVYINFRLSEDTILEWFVGTGVWRHLGGLVLDVAALILTGFNICGSVGSILVRLWIYCSSVPIPLTATQRKLLGIAELDAKFQSPAPASKSSDYTAPASPFSFSDLSWLFHVTPKKRRSPGSSSIAAGGGSPYCLYASGLAASPSNNQGSTSTPQLLRFSPSVKDYSYSATAGSSAADTSFNEALENVRRRSGHIPLVFEEERSPAGTSSRRTGQTTYASTIDRSPESFGSWQQSGEFSILAQDVFGKADHVSPSKSIDFSSLSPYKYQPSQNLNIDSIAAPVGAVASSSTTLGIASSTTATASTIFDSANPIWSRYGVVSVDVVEEQSLRLRLWISSTILKPLVEEIDAMNAKAAKTASGNRASDFVIGESSFFHVQSVAATKFDQYPTLGALLPYLELSANQGYLVERIRELGKRDACLKDFRWNSGSQYKNKPWDDRLPTDSDLIMHLFATYLNSALPLHPLYPEGKSFSCHYFLQYPAKPPAERSKDFLMIYQNSTTPPNFQLLVDDETLDVSKGKNNLFSTLLLFFHHLKSRCYGRLDAVSLAETGLNISWILD